MGAMTIKTQKRFLSVMQIHSVKRTMLDINSPYEEDDAPCARAATELLSRRNSALPSAPRSVRERESRDSRKRRLSQLNTEELRCTRCSESLTGNSRVSMAFPHKLAGHAREACSAHH